MATYSAFPITVDGFRLDSSAFNIDSKMRSFGAGRSNDLVVSGIDGELPSLFDDLQPLMMRLSMWVAGCDPTTGAIPGGSNAAATVRANLDILSLVFGKTHALLDIRETVDAAGTVRQWFGKVADRLEPEIRAGGTGKFTVSLRIPAGVGQDVSLATDFTITPPVSAAVYTLPSLAGTTGPISDGIFLFNGPAVNPRFTDPTTGAFCQLTMTLPAGSSWRLNTSTWASMYGVGGLTLSSADTVGTDMSGVTSTSAGSAPFLRLVPTLVSGVPQVRVTPSGTGFTAATNMQVRARRKFLQ